VIAGERLAVMRAIGPWLVAAGMAAVGVARLWSLALEPGTSFGSDLLAYQRAAERLMASGSPYHPALLAGPIENVATNVPIGYFYPPPIAQAFVFLTVLFRPEVLAVIWTISQVACLAWVLPRVYRASGGTAGLFSAGAVVALGVGFYPLEFALYIGNVSAWVAIGVGLMLLPSSSLRGVVGAVLALTKFVPLPLAAAATMSRSSRTATVATLAFLVVFSIALSWRSWVDWLTVLPNLARMAPAGSETNMSPAAVLGRLGFGPFGVALGWSLAAGFGVASLRWARRGQSTGRAVAAASVSMLFLSPTLWDHYLAVLVPLIVAAWPVAGRYRRLMLWAYVLWMMMAWTGVFYAEPLSIISLLLLILSCVALVAGPLGPGASPEPVAQAEHEIDSSVYRPSPVG